MTVDRNTRSKSLRRAKLAKNPAWQAHIPAHEARIPGSSIATAQLLRSPGQGFHKGAEVAKMIRMGKDGAPGGINMAYRDRDAAGPLKDNVGCTITKGSGEQSDYLRRRESRFDTPPTGAGHLIAAQRIANTEGYVPANIRFDRTVD